MSRRKFSLHRNIDGYFDLWALEDKDRGQYSDRHLASGVDAEEIVSLLETAQEAMNEMQGNVRCNYPDCDWLGPLGVRGSQFLEHFVCVHTSHIGEVR